MSVPNPTAPASQLRKAMIAAMKADAGVMATALGDQPRIHSLFAPPRESEEGKHPLIVLTTSRAPWHTTTEAGAEMTVELHLVGDGTGAREAEDILYACEKLFENWAPQEFADHRLVNLEFVFEDVRPEDSGREYFGVQRWRAVTERL